MRSIKPGRGPSMMGGIGSIAVGLFGVVWTIGAASMGAPGFFIFFGIIFIAIAVIQAIYNFKNATSENRMSLFDITEHEPDPLDDRFGNQNRGHGQVSRETQRASVEFTENSNDSDNSSKYSIDDSNGSHRSRRVNFCPSCGHNVSGKTYNYCPGCGLDINGL